MDEINERWLMSFVRDADYFEVLDVVGCTLDGSKMIIS